MFKPEYIQAHAARFLDNDWVNIASLRDYLKEKANSMQTPASSLLSRVSSLSTASHSASVHVKHENIEPQTLLTIKTEANDASSALRVRQENPAIKTQTVSYHGVDYIEILSSDDENDEVYVFSTSIICSKLI